MEAHVLCPLCWALDKVVRRVCDELDVPYRVKYMATHSVAMQEDVSGFRTFSEGWIKEHGSEEQRKLLEDEEFKRVLRAVERGGYQAFPSLVIRWHDGYRTREIVIRGYDREKADDFARNLTMLLYALKKTLYR